MVRETCLVASFILAATLCMPVVATARNEPRRFAEPVCITQGPGDNTDPGIRVNPDGRVFLAWKHHDPIRGATQICLSAAPDWATSPVADITTSQPEKAAFSLNVGEHVHLAWSEPMTLTQTLLWRNVWPKLTQPQRWQVPIPFPSTFVGDGGGALHSVWAQDDVIYYRSSSLDSVVTSTVGAGITVSELSLALEDYGSPHLAWSVAEPTGQMPSIYYASLTGQVEPVQVAAAGYRPRLTMGPAGRAHLCWMTERSLHYATSRDWTVSQVVVTGLVKSDVFALAAGPDEVAHLVWTHDGAIWYANSADWRCSVGQLARFSDVSGLDVAVDRIGRPQVVCAATNEEGARNVYYLGPARVSPQLSISYPKGGEVLGGDVLVRAESNLLATDLLRVEFYLEIDSGLEFENTSLSLGSDRDGRDGWTAPLHSAELSSKRRYRVVALAIDPNGRISRAVGNWFTVRDRTPWVWLEPPEIDASRGESSLAALAGSSEARLAHLGLFFMPAGPDWRQGPIGNVCSISPRSFYAGCYDLTLGQPWPGVQWRQLVYDSRAFPDGRYAALAMVTDRLARRACGCSTTSFSIDNTMRPSIEVTSPRKDATITNVLEASAIAGDRDGVIERVDFFAERNRPLLQTRYHGQEYALEMPDLFWLGSDIDGSDGWNIRVPIHQSLRGDYWHVRAVAFDDRGLSAAARSLGVFAVVDADAPHMLISTPVPGSTLCGTETINLLAQEGNQYLLRAQVYVRDLDDTLTYLGSMTEADGRWLYTWNTTTFPDGSYDLLVVGYYPDGRKSLARSDRLWVSNARSLYHFEEPAPNQLIEGSTLLHLECAQSVPGGEARFYYRDPAGQLRFIAKGTLYDGGWYAIWNTKAALDGVYDVVASVTSPEEHVSHATRRVRVCNVTPSIVFERFDDSECWRGTREVAWLAKHPAGKPMSVAVEYSPDDGTHWVKLASEIPSARSFLWDTTGYPDSNKALLRLTVSDRVHSSQTESDPFVLNNVNEPPQVTLLAPQPGAAHGNPVRIAWQAWDPDHDSLAIDLDYRRGSGPWCKLARNLSNAGYHLWETRKLRPADDYDLRITAIDSLDATAADLVQGIHLVSNTPPEMRLVAPRGGEHLDKETMIFWRATDKDQDDLLIDLYYSDSAGQVWLPLAEGLPNTGYYVWQVSYLPMGTQYRVRATARDGWFKTSDESDSVFSIETNCQPEVRLLSPTPGSNLSGTQLVKWWACSPNQTPLRITLMVRRSGSNSWDPLLQNAANDAFYPWDTKRYPDGEYDLRIAVTDGQSSASTALSAPVIISNWRNHPPRVVLTSPRGGESWAGIREITWRAWDRDREVITATLYLNLDGGRSWDKLASLDARAGVYLWDTSQTPPSRQALVRIVVTDGAVTTQDMSQGVFSLPNRQSSPPHALFTSPDASGGLIRGNTVAWIAEDVDGDTLCVSLSFSSDGGFTWHDLASRLADTGEYTLDTALLKIGSKNLLRLQVSDGMYRTQILSVPLELAAPAQDSPTLKIISPSGGERWSGIQTVRWQARDPVGQSLRVDIELSHDGGCTWRSLAGGIPNTGAYKWDTTQVENGVYCLRLAADNGQVRTVQTSDAFVADNPGRNAPVISIVCPRGGEIWSGTQQVRWEALDADGDRLTVNLAYSLDMGVTWHVIASAIPNVGNYVWDTTSMPNSDLVWLRATTSDGQHTAQDLGDGPFSVRNPNAPLVMLLAPTGGEQWMGMQNIAWYVAHDPDRTAKSMVQASLDMGRTWQTLARDLPSQGTYTWDTSALPENTRALVRVHATDGLQSGLATVWEPITIGGAATGALPLNILR